jgi:hypothetical protein
MSISADLQCAPGRARHPRTDSEEDDDDDDADEDGGRVGMEVRRNAREGMGMVQRTEIDGIGGSADADVLPLQLRRPGGLDGDGYAPYTPAMLRIHIHTPPDTYAHTKIR